jgi:hypothetical protein
MNVFLMMRLREAPLSISVLATLCLMIESLPMKGEFQLESSIWSDLLVQMICLCHQVVHRCLSWPDDDLLGEALAPLVCLASSYDRDKFYTTRDHVRWTMERSPLLLISGW